MSNVKDKLKDAGHAVAEAAKAVGHSAVEGAKTVGQKVAEGATAVGHKVAEGTGAAVDFVKDKTGLGKDHGPNVGVAGIKEHMPVYASCGTKVGAVDKVEGDKIKLTASDSKDGLHHWIPTAWVDHVDTHVHLNKNSMECQSAASSGACGSGSCGM